MKVALAQLLVEPGLPYENLDRAIRALEDAEKKGADLILLPEMVLPGYLLGDLWERPSFIKEVLSAQEELKAWTKAREVAIAFGGLGVDSQRKGDDGRIQKFIAFYMAQGGKWVPPESGPYDFSFKSLHPNYREFDDHRHFCSALKWAQDEGVALKEVLSPHVMSFGSQRFRVGPLLCEDSWSTDYGVDPASILLEQGVDLFCNLSSSPFTKGKNTKRNRLFKEQAFRYGKPMFYCNAVGIQNNGKTLYTFDGDSCVYGPEGERVLSAPLFQSNVIMADLDDLPKEPLQHREDDISVLHQAIVYGTREFLKQTGISKVVIGASGGVDSALVAAIYAEILEPENLLLVNMPSRFNSKTTISAAKELAENLGCLYTSVGIEDSVSVTRSQLEGLELLNVDGQVAQRLQLSSFVMENVQARDRSGRVLAAVAAAFGGAFTCNANKSETSVGYSTLYGDHAGFLANISDLWKGQVYDMCRYINNKSGVEKIPQAILDVKPSAELSDAQNPEQGLGDPFCYPYHDALFRSWVEDWNRQSPEEILEAYMEGRLAEHLEVDEELLARHFPTPKAFVDDLERWWRCYAGMGVAKRIQAPPILAVTRRAYGFDQRESQTKVLWTRYYGELKKKLLEDREA